MFVRPLRFERRLPVSVSQMIVSVSKPPRGNALAVVAERDVSISLRGERAAVRDFYRRQFTAVRHVPKSHDVVLRQREHTPVAAKRELRILLRGLAQLLFFLRREIPKLQPLINQAGGENTALRCESEVDVFDSFV